MREKKQLHSLDTKWTVFFSCYPRRPSCIFRCTWTVCAVQLVIEKQGVTGYFMPLLDPLTYKTLHSFHRSLWKHGLRCLWIAGKCIIDVEPWIPEPFIHVKPPFEVGNVFACQTIESHLLLNVIFVHLVSKLLNYKQRHLHGGKNQHVRVQFS